MVGLSLCFLFSLLGCGRDASQKTVVVYVSEDQVFSEPILKDFEKETGIRVRAVYDTEEAKGTGVMNRLIAEKKNPQGDVYWANEPIRAEILKQEGISTRYISHESQDIPSRFKDPDGHWTGFSARARVLVVNKGATSFPDSVLDYSDDRWKGRSVIANPLFGTTAVHIAGLSILWGEERTMAFLGRLKANGVKLATSNGESSDLVASGAFDFSLVDSDDAINRIRQGKPIKMVFPDQKKEEMGTLILPNAVLLIDSARHSENGKRLIDYLLTKETERKLAFAGCAQIPLRPGVEMPPDVPALANIKTMPLSYSKAARKSKAVQQAVKEYLDSWSKKE
jgi:iron(III) transport system substrate-binding protein